MKIVVQKSEVKSANVAQKIDRYFSVTNNYVMLLPVGGGRDAGGGKLLN